MILARKIRNKGVNIQVVDQQIFLPTEERTRWSWFTSVKIKPQLWC